MSSNPNPNQQSNNYGGYGGYTPSNPSDDPYGATAQSGHPGAPQNDPNYVYGQQQQQSGTYGQQQQQQQTNAYVPPSSVSGRGQRGGSSWSTQGQRPQATDQRSRLRALLSYLGLCFTGIFFLLRDRSNRYVSFHAAQSIALFAPLVVIYVVLSLLGGFLGLIPILGVLIALIFHLVLGILNFVIVVSWVAMMATSFMGITIRIPWVSEYADKIVARTSK
jgi:Predicted membrane protein